MQSKWVLTQPDFDALLAWLDPDRDRAALRYEEMRLRLIRLFIHRGSPIPEELADETINRVIRKIRELAGSYSGDPALYFCGVARNVYRETLKSRPNPPVPPIPDPIGEDSPVFQCLDKCMQGLPPETCDLILAYYQPKGREKIDNHKQIAERLGIETNALRLRIHRLRAHLKECVKRCIERSGQSM